MRVIISGSSGFIGAALAHKYLANGAEVLGIDSHTDYYSTDLKLKRLANLQLEKNFHFSELDVSNNASLTNVIAEFRPTTFIHLAAQAGVRIPTSHINKYVESNLTGFSSVLQSVALQEVPNFLYASSSSIYGDNAELPYRESEKILEPNSFYGGTKLANEILTKSLIHGTKTRARGLRFFTVYGPMGRPDMAYFRIISRILAGSSFELFGDGSIERDFTFIDDCTEMIFQLNKELKSRDIGFSDVVNVGGGNPVSITQIIELASRLTGRELEVQRSPRNSLDVRRTMASAEYLIQLVGSKPSTSIENGISQTIEWARNLDNSSQLLEWVDSTP